MDAGSDIGRGSAEGRRNRPVVGRQRDARIRSRFTDGLQRNARSIEPGELRPGLLATPDGSGMGMRELCSGRCSDPVSLCSGVRGLSLD